MPVESAEQPCEVEVKQPPLPAPWQHTLLLAFVLVLWAIYGALRANLTTSQMPQLIRYISTGILQWLLVGSTIAGLYHRRSFILGVLGLPARRRLGGDLLSALAILVSGWIVVIALRIGLRHTSLHVDSANNAVKALLPNTPQEMILWVFVAMTAGVCEEFIFRGYLQRQVSAWSGSAVVGIAIPSLIFGCLHLYQGIGSAIGITGLGLVYAICTARIGNVRSVMIAHASQDLLVGLIHYLRHS
ncbi:hypothetical protein HDF16_003710 [Granulicella aggregans]|uniref:CAAX prenyl protease 2/Lysostaphin resistance protein A-like domain-containing protein n=1 Tax=Granulicella aggregans TaxID=474949 RepID=A0A7W7ZFR1_9BACT|nr:type II CAAX endopeptidase family protein [Granulicella aggregans]MBB5058987.1 hypothetical protein [Granulicella aggregans]